MKNQILSCIQPTGELHIGNYFGAIANWVRLQDTHNCIYGIVDYHAMTMPYKADDLHSNSIEMARSLIACGIAPKNLFIQSLIPEHTELGWILGCLASYGDLLRQTQFKSKGEGSMFASAGLFTYPVLQAADILIYHADAVPVGKDQEQHLELSRTIANRFNHQFGADYFNEPQALFTKIPKVMSLADPKKKMSKSLGQKHYIGLFDDATTVRKKVSAAVTDSAKGTELSLGVQNLLSILRASGRTDLYDHFINEHKAGTLKYSILKEETASSLIALNTPFIERRNALDLTEVYERIHESSKVIRERAQQTLTEVREMVGLHSLKERVLESI